MENKNYITILGPGFDNTELARYDTRIEQAMVSNPDSSTRVSTIIFESPGKKWNPVYIHGSVEKLELFAEEMNVKRKESHNIDVEKLTGIDARVYYFKNSIVGYEPLISGEVTKAFTERKNENENDEKRSNIVYIGHETNPNDLVRYDTIVKDILFHNAEKPVVLFDSPGLPFKNTFDMNSKKLEALALEMKKTKITPHTSDLSKLLKENARVYFMNYQIVGFEPLDKSGHTVDWKTYIMDLEE
jgi:hypothetical protein